MMRASRRSSIPTSAASAIQLGYREALDDDVIAHFKIAFIGVRFGGAELRDYEEQDEKARKKRSLLVNQYGLTPEPFGVFMREVARL